MAGPFSFLSGVRLGGLSPAAWQSLQTSIGLPQTAGATAFPPGSPLAQLAAIAALAQPQTTGTGTGNNGWLSQKNEAKATTDAQGWLAHKKGHRAPNLDQVIRDIDRMDDPVAELRLTLALLLAIDPKSHGARESTRKLLELLNAIIEQILGEGFGPQGTGGLDENAERAVRGIGEQVRETAERMGGRQTRRAPHVEQPMDAVKGGSAIQGRGNVPWISQFSLQNGEVACFRAACEMARRGGATVLGPGDRIQVGRSKDVAGAVTVDSKAAAAGRDYIDRELTAGRPVVVGVSHTGEHHNVDDLTDHFVTVTSRGVDDQGRTFYAFNDPGTRSAQLGSDRNSNNRLYVDSKTGEMYRPGARGGQITSQQYEVTMVRTNRESPRASS
jgi:hypothetical protein